MSEVVVSGMGVVGPHGAGMEALAAALQKGRCASTEVDRSAGYHLPGSAHRAALAVTADLSRWVPTAAARRMSPPSRFALAAARMALEDAGLPPDGGDEASTAVALSTAFGPASFTEALLRQVEDEGPEAASPFLFTECVANAPAAEIGIHCRARGANITISQAEAGPLLAVLRAAGEVRAGRTRRALAGAVEEVTPLLHAILDRLGALARPRPECDEMARPLDRRRDGYLLAEGAAVLVLEREADARRRGARVLCRLRAGGRGFDPTAPAAGWGHGAEALAGTLRAGLARAGLGPGDFDQILTGAAGTRAGDRLEARVLRATLGDAELPPVLAPKGVTGEHGGGFLAAAVLAAGGRPLGPPPEPFHPDPDLGLEPHRGGPLDPPTRLLATSVAAGGAVAWIVLESP